MPKPPKKKIASPHLDMKAADHFRKASQFAALADRASSPLRRADHRTKAKEEYKAGIEALETAETLNSRE